MPVLTFTVVRTVEDSLLSDRLIDLLQDAKIDAFARARGAASADMLGAATSRSFEILVPTEALGEAAKLVQAEIDTIERETEANSLAAEQEYMSGEHPIPDDAK